MANGRVILLAITSSVVATAVAAVVDLPGFNSATEVFSVVTGLWSVWFLSRNHPFGWWIGMASVTGFAIVFFDVRLYAEVGIQIFYFITSLQAIYIWLRGGPDKAPRPVSSAPPTLLVATVPAVAIATILLRLLLLELNGAAPGWDAITTVLSLTAHLYLMWRFVESWWLWITVDVIYIPLYASRGLELTAALYAAFLVMSILGLMRFRRELEAAFALHPERS
jgi:nicotinamide mononucleotide transporter